MSVALVTGAVGGIGAGIVTALRETGWEVMASDVQGDVGFVGVEALVVGRQARGVRGQPPQGRAGRVAERRPQPGLAQVVVGRAVEVEDIGLVMRG